MKNILIAFGCGQGIGFECVSQIKFNYYKVLVITRTKHIAHENNDNVTYIYKDLFLSNYKDDVDSFIDANSSKEVHIINSAAKVGDVTDIQDINVDKLSDDILYNLKVTIEPIIQVINKIDKSKRLKVILFAGGGAAYAYPKFYSYGLSKVALVRWAETAAVELTEKGYQTNINILAPGAVNTQLYRYVAENGGSVKTFCDASESAIMVSYLFSESANKINGRYLHVREEHLDSYDWNDDEIFRLRRIDKQ